jgi:xanthosine utilization system XapX-like protein
MTATTTSPPTQGQAQTQTRDLPGLLLARLTVLPVVAALFFLLVAFPLLLIGWFRPVPVLALTGLAVLIGVTYSLRRVRRPVPGTPWWALAALVVIALGFTAFQLHYRSAFVIVTRDPASYMQFATWIGKHGSLPIPADTKAFGAATHLVQFDSFAYFQVGHVIVPQFMAGLPMMLAAASWFGGTFAALSMGPLLGGAAVLTFGGLAARLVGPRWAVAATLTLAVSFPDQFTSRSTYSEPLAQVLLLGGLCLILDSQRAERSARTLAALAGLALGTLLLVRLDGASDTLPVLPWCGALLLARRPQAIPVLAGLAVGTGYGLIDGLFLTRPYLKHNISSVAPLALVTFLVIAVTGLAILATQRGAKLPRPRWLPNAAAALPVVILTGAAVRAFTAATPINKYNYSAHSLQWIIWWAGVPIVVVATIGAAILARRVLQNESLEWVLPLLISGWTIAVFLGRPAITPDQPWASRRLVPAVLPACILLAAWAGSWLTRWIKRKGFAGPPAKLFAACCSLALVAPPAWIAFAPHLGSGGVSLRGLAVQDTYHGELAAVDKLCAAIPADSSVVVIDGPIADRLLEAIRGMCGVPTARLRDPTIADVRQVISDITATGRRPVLLGRHATDLSAYSDGTVKEVMNLHTQLDDYDFGGVPRSTWSYSIAVWMWEQNK